MIVARYFGWSAVAGPHQMDWTEFWVAVQLLSEERVGTLVRQEAAREDAAFQAAITPETDES